VRKSRFSEEQTIAVLRQLEKGNGQLKHIVAEQAVDIRELGAEVS
jgi:predicted phage gp36 major capsid-like protein